MSNFLNQIIAKEGSPPLNIKKKEVKPRKFNPLFLSVINDENRGKYIVTLDTYLELSKECEEAIGIKLLEWLDDNKINIEPCRGGYLLSKRRELTVLRGAMRK